MVEIRGMTGAAGCAAGTAVILEAGAIDTGRRIVADVATELAALEEGRARYGQTLTALAVEQGEDGAAILEAYREVLGDDVFFDSVKELAVAEGVCIAWAIEQKRAETEALFLSLDDPYLSARADDVNNVCRELIAELQGVAAADPFAGVEGEALILFAEDLTPADALRLDASRLAGIVTERGGVASHIAILAKSLGIPAVVGAGPMLGKVRPGECVLVDGAAGTAILGADQGAQAAFLARRAVADERQALFDRWRGMEAYTKDGHLIRVCVNSGDRESVERFDPGCCDGVGLFRTEFLYLDKSDYPSEDDQYRAYRDIALRAAGKEVVIRTLDAGGDKVPGYMDLLRETNPALGYRAIRLCLDRPELFKTQLRAILRAAVHGNVKMMLPMIVSMEELYAAKDLLEEAKGELSARSVPFQEELPVGIMVETPAAVFLSDKLARQVSFFSIGSNDLTQYITAADRQNERVSRLYDGCNPAVLRAVKLTCDNARAHGVEVGVCGETASEPRLIPLWAAMGVDKLSVAPALVGQTKYILSRISKAEQQDTLRAVLNAECTREVKALLDAAQARMWE